MGAKITRHGRGKYDNVNDDDNDNDSHPTHTYTRRSTAMAMLMMRMTTIKTRRNTTSKINKKRRRRRWRNNFYRFIIMLYIDERISFYFVVVVAVAVLISSVFSHREILLSFFSLFGSFTVAQSLSGYPIYYLLCCEIPLWNETVHFPLCLLCYLLVFVCFLWPIHCLNGSLLACCSCYYVRVRWVAGWRTALRSFRIYFKMNDYFKIQWLWKSGAENMIVWVCFCVCFWVGAFSLLFLFISFFLLSVSRSKLNRFGILN